MYQQAHRLSEMQRLGGADDYLDLAVLQARSYLAAMNVLALVERRNAWFADVLPESAANERDDKTADGGMRQVRGKRKLSSYIPAEHWQPGAKELQIVQLDDIRREYRLVLARLELVQQYPELANSSEYELCILTSHCAFF